MTDSTLIDASVSSEPTSRCRRVPPTLETLNVDVFRMITLELELQRPGLSLKRLASSPRTLRALTSPILFSRCRAWPHSDVPHSICHFIRHLQYHMTYLDPQAALLLRRVLERLSFLTAITFVNGGFITWDALRVCFAIPRITSLTLGPNVELVEMEQYSSDGSPAFPIPMSAFTYNTPFWWELEFLGPGRDLPEIYSQERACLSQLLPLMNESLRQLSLPMEATPLNIMAELTWPKLRALAICGRYDNPARVGLLPTLLSGLPKLSMLSIQILPCPHPETERAPILGRHPSPRDVLCGLRSLTVAYPDPEDSIFSVDTANLAQLSIRDCPRSYERLGSGGLFHWTRPCPLLSPAECLSILSRMDMPRLSSLELVYLVEAADEDDELLKYIVITYLNLSHLELHRYRRDRDQAVDYHHIATQLSELRSLRTIHLNLDFEKDHGAYCADRARRRAWFPILRTEYGPQIVEIMQICPRLEYVGLLYHNIPTAIWLEFHPPRCAEPRFVLLNDAAHKDSVSVPGRWHLGLSAIPRLTPP